MPRRPPRICSEPGCGAVVPSGSRCPKHLRQPRRRKPWPHATPSRHARGYGSEWDRIRRRILERDPVCTICRRAPSSHVDHVRSRGQRGSDDPGNLRGVCKPCHDEKTKREAADGRRASRSRRPGKRG